MIGCHVLEEILWKWLDEHPTATRLKDEEVSHLAHWINGTLLALHQQGHVPDAIVTEAALRVLGRRVMDGQDLVAYRSASGLCNIEQGGVVRQNLSDENPLHDALVRLARSLVQEDAE